MITTIRFNPKEIKMLEEMEHRLGLASRSATIKACIPWAKQRIDTFLKEFEDVIQPLKMSEVDYLITTMKISYKEAKLQRKKELAIK